ncbi:type II toxin-antitoxin system RelE/ParE family toxin [Escherichia coli]|nr:type II toxin-antitoxin system RelE/ParE family toxin [Escherichia coli]EFG9153059.1 type II toxin-antitoxin system RelE/ParE family toxin [Escherichia coli]
MPWRVRLEKRAEKDLSRIAAKDRERILRFLHDRVAPAEDPRDIGEALTGPLSGFWKYRVGDFRIICHIDDGQISILVVRIGNRREVYR